MERTFTSATDDVLIDLIRSARQRLAVISPGLTKPVAEALVKRMDDLPELSLTIILDADPEVYRMGYGDVEALATIQHHSRMAHFDLREQPGVRIGVVISDDRTIVYAPVSRNLEAGSTSPEHPNAIVLNSQATATLALASGATPRDDSCSLLREVGVQALTPEKIERMEIDLEFNPPRPFDLTRRLTVFTAEVQYAELRLSNALFSARTIKLPSEFQKIADEKLREGIKASLKIPIDSTAALRVEHSGKEHFVSEAFLKRERAGLEDVFLYDWKGRGKVIFRKDRKTFEAKVNDFISLTKAYQEAIKADLDTHRADFCQKMVREFLPHWRENPPSRLRHRDQTDDPSLIADIESRAATMFDSAIEMGAPEAKYVYKDISIEDLDDDEMMANLRELMIKAHVDHDVVEKLFSKHDAVGVGRERSKR